MKQFAKFFNKLLPDIGRVNIFKKLLDKENTYIFALYKNQVTLNYLTIQQVVGGCVFKPHLSHDFIELFYLGVNPLCQKSVRYNFFIDLKGIGS